MTDFKLLEDLCRARGISGQEAAVRELIMDQVKPYADQITLDNLGNLLVFKQGAERPKTKLMLSAHMDEVGFIVTHVTENGFLKVAPVGGIDKRAGAWQGGCWWRSGDSRCNWDSANSFVQV